MLDPYYSPNYYIDYSNYRDDNIINDNFNYNIYEYNEYGEELDVDQPNLSLLVISDVATEEIKDDVCTICLCELCSDNNNQVVSLPCNHQFHSACINQAFHHNRSCPLCRKSFV